MSHVHVDPKPYWDKQSPIFDRLKNEGFRAYIGTISSIAAAFELQDRTIRCIDEGTPGGLHIAGEGILMTREQALAFAERAKPDGVMSHEECGACGLYAKEKNLDASDTDVYGGEWVKTFGELANIPVKGNIAVGDMARPAGLHVARVAYYDGTGSFDCSRVSELPPGFVVSRAYLEPEYAKREAEIAASIAFGGHGFGELFTENDPFYLVAVAADDDTMENLKRELNEVASKFGSRVKVDGFVKMKVAVGA